MSLYKIAGTKMDRGKGIIVYGTLSSSNPNSKYFILFPPNVGHIRCMHACPHRRKD